MNGFKYYVQITMIEQLRGRGNLGINVIERLP